MLLKKAQKKCIPKACSFSLSGGKNRKKKVLHLWKLEQASEEKVEYVEVNSK